MTKPFGCLFPNVRFLLSINVNELASSLNNFISSKKFGVILPSLISLFHCCVFLRRVVCLYLKLHGSIRYLIEEIQNGYFQFLSAFNSGENDKIYVSTPMLAYRSSVNANTRVYQVIRSQKYITWNYNFKSLNFHRNTYLFLHFRMSKVREVTSISEPSQLEILFQYSMMSIWGLERMFLSFATTNFHLSAPLTFVSTGKLIHKTCIYFLRFIQFWIALK